jgi:hypothetical protein
MCPLSAAAARAIEMPALPHDGFGIVIDNAEGIRSASR